MRRRTTITPPPARKVRPHAAVVAGGALFLGVFVPLWWHAGVWAVLALVALAVITAGHVVLTGELFALRVELEQRRQQDLERLMRHRREDVPTMFLARPGRHSA